MNNINHTYSKGIALRAEAKKLRAKARRLEAKGQGIEAMELRDRAQGCLHEAQWSDQHGGA